MAPSDPDIIYAGAQRLWRSDNLGDLWIPTSEDPVDGENPILTIAIDPGNPYLVYVATASPTGASAGVFKSANGGVSWESMNGLPDRVAMDISIHPEDPERVYVVFSGFGSAHLYRSEDGGDSWQPLGEAYLPDVPANTLAIDPLYPDHMYLGNDLGVFASTDGGATWVSLAEGLPEALMAMHLSISASNRKLRLATHGHGVYEIDLVPPAPSGIWDTEEWGSIRIFPNPASDRLQLECKAFEGQEYTVELLDRSGKRLWQGKANATLSEINLEALVPGLYYCVIARDKIRQVLPFVVVR